MFTVLDCYYIFNRNGAAIVVNSQSILPLIFERNYFNRLCFIQYSNSYVPPSQWDQVKYIIIILLLLMDLLIFTSFIMI